jgi:chromosome segregation ATPase
MKQLEQSLADAISERDFAKREVDSLREQQQSLRDSEKSHLSHELDLADELRSSAKRVEELATQVRQQLASNATLRQRLAETIERGEKDQKANAEKIMFMQSKLKSLEDQLMTAQHASEDRVARHEEEIRGLKESHNDQLQRMKSGLRSPRLFGPKSPIAPIFANSAKAPRIMSTSSGKAMTVSEDSKMGFLKQRVVDLEAALADADKEMEEVVGRMNVAQIEVMELQNEREEAVRETKRLQKIIEEERVRAFQGRFATLSS